MKIDLIYIHHTLQAVLVRDDIGEETWLPRSQIKTDRDVDLMGKGEIFEAEVPEWLLTQKNLTP